MDRFNPYDYSDVINTEASSLKGNTIIFKGNGNALRINLDEIDERLVELRKVAHVQISKLQKKDDDNLKAVLHYINLLYKCQSYPILYKHVIDHFGDLTPIIPGTVGAYFIGCHHDVEAGKPNPQCSTVCAGGLPPNDPNWEFCKNQVVLATYENNRFKFDCRAAGDGQDKEVAYVYVAYTSINTFPGFSEEEKKELRRLGIRRVYLRGFNNSATEGVDLGLQGITLEEIKDRVAVTNSEFSVSSGIFIALLIVLIIIALFFAWRISQVNSRSVVVATA